MYFLMKHFECKVCLHIWLLLFETERYLSRSTTKPTKWHMRPAKTQISLGIRPVWSESSLCAQWISKDPMCLHADSEDSDQTLVFAGRTCHFVGFVVRRFTFFFFSVLLIIRSFDRRDNRDIWQSVWVCTHLMRISIFEMQISAFEIETSAFKCRYIYLNTDISTQRNRYLYLKYRHLYLKE